MPIAVKDYADAIAALRANSHSVWNPNKPELLNDEHGCNRIHKKFSDIHAPVEFTVPRESNFFCIGSCFARELEDAISEIGLNALTKSDAEQMVLDSPDLFERVEGVMGRPIAFVNRYNLGSMDDLMTSVKKNNDPQALHYPNGKDEYYDYHYTRFLRALPLEQAQERRAKITSMYHEAAKKADVFVFTLGLAEAFFDTDEGAYLNVTPDPRTARGKNIEYRFLDYEQNLAHLRSVVESVRAISATAKIIITVSPVPLDSTFSGKDIVVANNLAKSLLISVAHTVCAEADGCFYFPSFEMVTTSDQESAWLWDKKHVSRPMVAHIMKSFTERHIE